MKIKHIISILVCSSSIGAGAQDLSTEITVDRTIVAELPDATPLSSVMPVAPALRTDGIGLQPAIYTEATDFAPIAGRLNLAPYTGLSSMSPYRGYALLGYFPAYNLEAVAGYRFIDDKATQLGAAIRFNGLSYKDKSYEQSPTVSDNAIAAQAFFSHSFRRGATISLSADYRHNALKSPVTGTDNGRQGLDYIRIKAGIGHEGNTSYGVSAAISSFTQSKSYAGGSDDPAGNSIFALDGFVRQNLGSASSLQLGLGASLMNAKGVTTPYGPREELTPGIFTLSPAYIFSFDEFRIKAGVVLSGHKGHGEGEKFFHIAPDISLLWQAHPSIEIFTTVTGGQELNTLEWQYNQSAFAPGAFAGNARRTPIDGRFGFNFMPGPGLRLSLSGGYSSVKNTLVYAQVKRDMPVNFEEADIEGWNYGASVRADLGRYGHITAEGRRHVHGDASSADLAGYTVRAGLTLKPIEKLNFNIGYELRADRRYTEISPGSEVYGMERRECRLDNLSTLSLGAQYSFTGQLTAFVRLDNLLGRKALTLPLLHEQGFHGLVGASYRF